MVGDQIISWINATISGIIAAVIRSTSIEYYHLIEPRISKYSYIESASIQHDAEYYVNT